MKDIYELLRQKELEISRLEIEVEALRVVAPLLSENQEVAMTIGRLDPFDHAIAAHQGSKGGKRQSTTRARR